MRLIKKTDGKEIILDIDITICYINWKKKYFKKIREYVKINM